jgi:hypothetical protein
MRDAADIQYAPVTIPRPAPPPEWLKAIGEFLRAIFEPIGKAIGLSWPVLQWVLIAVAVAAVGYIVWKLIEPLLDRPRRAAQAETPEWTPDRAKAVALLADADRLAEEGRYGEAAHLLLQRSVHHISAARPGWLHPATTSREIALAPRLPERARNAFGEIAAHVERSLFALRELGLDDWQSARRAYADFALQRIPGEGSAL